MRIVSAFFVTCLLATTALTAEEFKISFARMPRRDAADLSCLFKTVTNSSKSATVGLYGGAGVARWDDLNSPSSNFTLNTNYNADVRLHVDANVEMKSMYFSTGAFFAYGATGSVYRNPNPALGIRSTLGFQKASKNYVGGNKVFVGAYWEFAAGLSSDRASRGGAGIEVGVKMF